MSKSRFPRPISEDRDFLNSCSQRIEQIKIDITNKQLEIERLEFITEKAKETDRKIEMVMLQIRLLERLISNNATAEALQAEYETESNKLVAEFIEVKRDNLNSKDKSGIFKYGKVVKLTSELRDEELNKFTKLILPLELVEFKNFSLLEIKEPHKLLTELNEKSNYLKSFVDTLRDNRINLAMIISEEIQAMHAEIKKTQSDKAKRIKNSLWGCCMYGSNDDLNNYLKKSGFGRAYKGHYITNEQYNDGEKCPIALLSLRQDGIMDKIVLAKTLLSYVEHFDPVDLVKARKKDIWQHESNGEFSYHPKIEPIDTILQTALKHDVAYFRFLLMQYLQSIKSPFEHEFILARGENQRTYLHIAADIGLIPELAEDFNFNRNKFKELIDLETDQQDGRNTALHLASKHGHLESVKWLLNNNADASKLNTHNQTALMIAIIHKKIKIAILLLDNGIRLTSQQEQTLLQGNHLTTDDLRGIQKRIILASYNKEDPYAFHYNYPGNNLFSAENH